MTDVSVTARVASTHPVKKYNGVRLSVEALRGMAAALNTGAVPAVFDHSPLEAFEVRNVEAHIVRLDDGEHVLEATFDVDEAVWRSVEDRFATANVPGGFSFTAGEVQEATARGEVPVVALSLDAGAFSDTDRVEAWKALSRSMPTQVSRLYQFSAPDVARIIIEIWPAVALGVGINLASAVLYDALKGLIRRRGAPTVIEFRRHRADGTVTNAIVATEDPEVVRVALETLDEQQDDPILQFDAERGLWLPRHRDGES
jgi:hypothetical protein